MIRALILAAIVLIAAEASACSRCGIFGRGCRLQSHHVAEVVAAPVIAAPPISIINNYAPPNGAAATLIAPQGGTVYGLSTAVQAYSIDPAAVLRQAAELTKGAQQLAQQGLQGYGQTAALALTLQASQPAITAAVTQPAAPPPPQQLTIELRDGRWQIAQPKAVAAPAADDPPSPVAPPPVAARSMPLTAKHCGRCHGVDIAAPKGGVYLGVAEVDSKISLSAVAQVMSGKMPPGTTLSAEDKAALVVELSQAK